MTDQKTAYRSPRDAANTVIEPLAPASSQYSVLRAPLRKALIAAFIERDTYWKEEMARIHADGERSSEEK